MVWDREASRAYSREYRRKQKENETPEQRKERLAKRRQYYADNAERERRRSTDWRRQNPDKIQRTRQSDNHKARHRKNRYGLTKDAFDRLIAAQEGVCVLCQRTLTDPFSTCVDHVPGNGKIRGILCRSCNGSLGKLGDTMEGLQKALRYMCANVHHATSLPDDRAPVTNGEKIRYRRYGITPSGLDRLLSAQHGACGLCEKDLCSSAKKFHIDHCHVTERVRGILCSACNSGLAGLGDSEEGLLKAINYVKMNS